jgi:hypothetical protein
MDIRLTEICDIRIISEEREILDCDLKCLSLQCLTVVDTRESMEIRDKNRHIISYEQILDGECSSYEVSEVE